MYVDLTTGNDSFKARTNSSRRNVTVQTWTRVEPANDGRVIVPMFQAYQQKYRGFRSTKLVHTIPATENFGAGIAGTWYLNRSEVMPGTEIMIEYRHREATGFGEETEHLLLIADENAPLYRIRLDLPPHEMSAVPCIFFEGRFIVVNSDGQLDKKAVAAWQDWIGIAGAEDFDLSDVLDSNMGDDRYFVLHELEGAIKSSIKTTVTASNGERRVKIRRARKIKT